LLDCEGSPELADCQGRCVLDESCQELFAQLVLPSDSDLIHCFEACGTAQGSGCLSCLVTTPDGGGTSCLSQLAACMQDQVCVDYLTCTTDGTCGTPEQCHQKCEADFSTATASELLDCACGPCAAACSLWCATGGGGAGGTAGSGGTGG
jgi:hypothetical protein